MINADQIFIELNKLIPSNKLVVAYSGGLDSHVLLHLLAQMPEASKKVRAIHINHGLQKSAEQWVTHCLETSNALGINCEVISLNLKIPIGKSLEAIAREERYKVLHQALDASESLLTAHHQNDQAETLLLQLFRGSGVAGLASMPSSRMFGPRGSERQLVRPLLPVSRESLEVYAVNHKLDAIEDISNLDVSFDRNFLRQDIIPQLRSRWRGIDRTIARAASLQAESIEILNEVAECELRHVLDHKKKAISILKLQKLAQSKQKLVVRFWLSEQGFSRPSEKKFRHLFSDVIGAKSGAQPVLSWPGAEVRRFKGYLYLLKPLANHDAGMVINWDLRSPLIIESLGIELQPHILPSGSSDVTVRFRGGGEKVVIPKRGNLSLKNIFQEKDVPPWLRNRIPLLYVGEELVRVVGLDL